jgi:GNAT superfamily N-acetyltransferase
VAAGVTFRAYVSTDKNVCLSLFDANCPAYFAPNERRDYSAFLDANPPGYEICLRDEAVVGAFGLIGELADHRSLNWILIDPKTQGRGIGSATMSRVVDLARAAGISVVRIAASHKSAPFFSKFGAVQIKLSEHGWGPNMHRVDMEIRL